MKLADQLPQHLLEEDLSTETWAYIFSLLARIERLNRVLNPPKE